MEAYKITGSTKRVGKYQFLPLVVEQKFSRNTRRWRTVKVIATGLKTYRCRDLETATYGLSAKQIAERLAKDVREQAKTNNE